MDQENPTVSDFNGVGALSNSEAITEAVTTGAERESGHPDPFLCSTRIYHTGYIG